MVEMKTLTINDTTYEVVDANAVKTVNGVEPDENGNIEVQTGVQPDWNQNDETQPDYVKNKPVLDNYATKKDIFGAMEASY